MDIINDLNENWTSTTTSFKSQVQLFYENANVFLTGGTGFLGKLLVEKLLRSTDVGIIYMLIREKKGKTAEKRLEEYFDDVVFDRLKTVKPKYKHRVVVIQGDCSLPNLGLSLNDQTVLVNNVNVVFHVAATVNFNQPLRSAYAINVKGTESVLNLSKQLKSLKAFVYVSTAYSNCHLSKIDETFYDVAGYKDVELIMEKMDDGNLEFYTEKILGKWPNTYTFTKALAESVIKDQGNGVTAGIFRPAIVTSTYKEPLEGWTDNMYGPTGACTGAASGILRVLQCREEIVANIVPGDMCVSALIASAWDTANVNAEKRIASIPIYNYVSSVENPITWKEYHTINKMYGHEYPFSNMVWCIKFIVTSNPYVYNLKKLLYHYVPAISLDFFGLFLGKKPRFLKLYNKVHKFADVITYFATTDLSFSNANVVNLWRKMNDEDKKLFSFSIAGLNWINYFKTYVLGIRLYLLKDPIDTIPQAKLKHTRLQILHSALRIAFWFISMNFVWKTFFNHLYLYTRKRLTYA